MAPQNIVVTGFGPFGEHKVNASWEAVSLLPEKLENFHLVKEQIPVVYKHVESKIPELWNKYNPKLIVHVGVSSYTSVVQLESCAHKSGYERRDIENCCPKNGAPCCAGDECIKTGIDVNKICERINKLGQFRACRSDDPGRYLCEFIYYTSLNIDRNRSLFIHVPPLNKPYTSQQLAEVLAEVIKYALIQLEEIDTAKKTEIINIYKNGRAAEAFCSFYHDNEVHD
ncbi:pyroglutamyl-peptidase 1 [Cylas formicarius]|uniref:pyroglutamyl-peptidase 1 n=1 Tax=Cylas formicarius TaxID=197179 RepID=UPI0029586F09|nr:pyroglutamyl-peptidase 1 [Cylas formicarius]XP_060536332.1 pyroglutamyl-peptidase 1 [Cylas formicarius]XP_060536333.1 pyroglutamyl-peptidase 1 [Cylas formicarius]XP_060536335.1 pyroglutamyl-peptidase 1 [Cylas formicarius]XP_060536336.1 pyroglutamyl-peptidase 1 [Cylas formicarius]